MDAHVRLVPILPMVRKVQSDGQTIDHRGFPSVDPASELFCLLPFLLIFLEVNGGTRANGFMSFFPV